MPHQMADKCEFEFGDKQENLMTFSIFTLSFRTSDYMVFKKLNMRLLKKMPLILKANWRKLYLISK